MDLEDTSINSLPIPPFLLLPPGQFLGGPLFVLFALCLRLVMFRTVLPRAAPRAALRASPKAVPSTFIAPPMLFIGRSKRGYASEAGEFTSPRAARKRSRCFLMLPGAKLLISGAPDNRRPRPRHHRWWCRRLRCRHQGRPGGSKGMFHSLTDSDFFSSSESL